MRHAWLFVKTNKQTPKRPHVWKCAICGMLEHTEMADPPTPDGQPSCDDYIVQHIMES